MNAECEMMYETQAVLFIHHSAPIIVVNSLASQTGRWLRV